jgi:hypothetical protein
MYIGAKNVSGTSTYAASHQYSAAWIGAGLTGAQYLLIANRINAYKSALGINVY